MQPTRSHAPSTNWLVESVPPIVFPAGSPLHAASIRAVAGAVPSGPLSPFAAAAAATDAAAVASRPHLPTPPPPFRARRRPPSLRWK